MTELQDNEKLRNNIILKLQGALLTGESSKANSVVGVSESRDLIKGRVLEWLSNGSQYWY